MINEKDRNNPLAMDVAWRSIHDPCPVTHPHVTAGSKCFPLLSPLPQVHDPFRFNKLARPIESLQPELDHFDDC